MEFNPDKCDVIRVSKTKTPVLYSYKLHCIALFEVFPCSLSSCFVIPFSIVITSLGEEGAGLCASRALFFFFFYFFIVLYVLVFFIFLVLLVSGVGSGL